MYRLPCLLPAKASCDAHSSTLSAVSLGHKNLISYVLSGVSPFIQYPLKYPRLRCILNKQYILLVLNSYYPLVIWHSQGKWPIYRWFSHWNLHYKGFSMAMLNNQRVVFIRVLQLSQSVGAPSAPWVGPPNVLLVCDPHELQKKIPEYPRHPKCQMVPHIYIYHIYINLLLNNVFLRGCLILEGWD